MNIYNQAIKINPNDSFAYKQRGISRSNLGDEQREQYLILTKLSKLILMIHLHTIGGEHPVLT
ncbi:tetratricopeptide repeat protein [Aphanizomenon flos-aquae]|uniref:tetratricopeptide repeat protein n=1 Tax=Aphanizomenon flos-aquae TaxID=1176 RepID=UPI003B9686B4